MKRILVLLTVLLLVFVAGCGDKEVAAPSVAAPEEPAAPTEPAETAPVAEPEPEPEPAPTQQNDADVVKLLEKHTKVKSLSYMYQDPENYPEFHEYIVKDDKIAVIYTVLDQDNPVGKIDSIYIDLSAKKATAYCERASYNACPDKNKEHPLTFSTYVRDTSIDWIEKVEYAEITGQEQLDNRNVKVLKTTIDGKDTTMWVDDYYGTPLKIDYGGDEYRFQDTAFNAVDEMDLEHQHIEIGTDRY